MSEINRNKAREFLLGYGEGEAREDDVEVLANLLDEVALDAISGAFPVEGHDDVYSLSIRDYLLGPYIG